MQKNEVIQALREMADLLEVTEASTFEVNAYRNGAEALDEWSGDLHQAVTTGTLTDIASIGKGLAALISDLVTAGTSTEQDRVRGLVPPDLPRLLSVRGLGPKRVRALWKDLGIESPGDLRRAAEAGRVQSLRGFGAKTVEKILSGLDYLERPVTPKSTSIPKQITMSPASTSSGRIWAGMSGYSYPQWKGSFYPQDAKADDFLEIYARRLSTVEINNTFYRFPSEKVIQQWLAKTPDHFHFAVKAHRRFTHQLRLSAAASEGIAEFVARCGQLGRRLGCILFQLPPDFRRDDTRLENLLSSLPAGPRYAVEFRHPSWLDDAVEQRLAGHNIGLVAGEGENEASRQCVTADFVYARMRRASYTTTEFADWDAWFKTQVAAKRDVLAYFKHDEDGHAPTAVAERWGIRTKKMARSAVKGRTRGKTG